MKKLGGEMGLGMTHISREELKYQTDWYEWTESENIEGLRLALSEGQEIDQIVIYGVTAATLCSKKDLLRAFEFLRKEGADFNKLDGNKMTPLMAAASGGSTRILQKLLSRGTSETYLGTKNEDGQNAMHFAAIAGSVSAIEVLSKAGSSVNEQDNDGRTALHYSMRAGSPAAVQALLTAGASADIQDKDGKTPDKMPGSLKVCRDVLNNGYLSASGSSMGGLMGSLSSGLSLGAAAGSSGSGSSPSFSDIEDAISSGDSDQLYEYLDEEDVDVNVCGPSGKFPLQFAVALPYHPEIVNVLLDYGAYIDAVSSKGSALHSAVLANQPENIKLLLEMHIDTDLLDSGNMSARELADSLGHEHCIAVFDEQGITAKSKSGMGYK